MIIVFALFAYAPFAITCIIAKKNVKHMTFFTLFALIMLAVDVYTKFAVKDILKSIIEQFKKNLLTKMKYYQKIQIGLIKNKQIGLSGITQIVSTGVYN